MVNKDRQLAPEAELLQQVEAALATTRQLRRRPMAAVLLANLQGIRDLILHTWPELLPPETPQGPPDGVSAPTGPFPEETRP